jgi:hypothetical protein
MTNIENILSFGPSIAAGAFGVIWLSLYVFKKNSAVFSRYFMTLPVFVLLLSGVFIYLMSCGNIFTAAGMKIYRGGLYTAIIGAFLLLMSVEHEKQAEFFYLSVCATVICLNQAFFRQAPAAAAVIITAVDLMIYCASVKASQDYGRVPEVMGWKMLYLTASAVFIMVICVSSQGTKAYRLGMNGFLFFSVMSANFSAFTLSPARDPEVKRVCYPGLFMSRLSAVFCQLSLIMVMAESVRAVIIPGFFAVSFGVMTGCCAFRSITEEKLAPAAEASIMTGIWVILTAYMSCGLSAAHAVIALSGTAMSALCLNEFYYGRDVSKYTVASVKYSFDKIHDNFTLLAALIFQLAAEVFIIWQAPGFMKQDQTVSMVLIFAALAYLPALLNRLFFVCSMVIRIRIDRSWKLGFNVRAFKIILSAAFMLALIIKW